MIEARIMRWAGHVACEESRGVYRVLVGSPEGNKQFGGPTLRREIILKMNLQ